MPESKHPLALFFKNPSPEFRGAPFWAWNTMLDKDEMLRQTSDMLEHGLGGGFMHSRVGLETPYMQEEFLDIVKAVVKKGEETGFKAYLYDEDRWPSGFAGGEVPKAGKGDEFRNKYMAMQEKESDIPVEGTVLAETSFGVSADRIDPDAEPVAYVFTERVAEPSRWFNQDTYGDNLNPDSVAKFIEVTFERYKEHVGEYFGTVIPAIFTDEPNVLSWHGSIRGLRVMPWTTALPARFEKEFGYSLIENLQYLFFYGENSFRVRHDYWKTISDMFTEAFSKQIGEWCGKNNIALTGHMLAEGSLESQIRVGGSVMPHYEFMQIPGIDILRESISENLTVKQCSSVMHQMGRKRMLSELYGCSGWDFSFEGQKWVGDWQICLGVNLRCQHLTWYTMKGSAKRDYPPCFNYQHPMWEHYNGIEDYFGRISYILSQGDPVIETLLIHPVRSGWGTYGDGTWDELRRVDRELTRTMDILLEGHADFDLGDETILERHGTISDSGKFRVNEMEYRTVIVPTCLTLSEKTLSLLEEFAEKGGNIIALTPLPVRLGTEISDRPASFLRRHASCICNHTTELMNELRSMGAPTLEIVSADGRDLGQIIYQQRLIDGETFVFMVNRDRSAGYDGFLCLNREDGVCEWDLKTGEVRPYGAWTGDGSIRIPFSIPATGSLMFSVSEKYEKQKPSTAVPETQDILVLGTEWKQNRTHPNGLPVDFCRYRIDEGDWSEQMQIIKAHTEICRDLNVFRDVESRWVFTKDLKKLGVRVEIESRFNVSVIPENAFLAMEESDGAEVLVNGKNTPAFEGWYMDRCIRKTPIAGLMQEGENVVNITWDYRDGMQIEEFYIIGDFGVDMQRNITREPETIQDGDYCFQGYPFYSGSMEYSREIKISLDDKSRYILELDSFNGIGVLVGVNGKPAGDILWPPLNLDITENLKDGSNALKIKVIGSPRNLLGPNHIVEKYPSWTGPGQFLTFEGDGYTSDYNIVPHGLNPGSRIRIVSI